MVCSQRLMVGLLDFPFIFRTGKPGGKCLTQRTVFGLSAILPLEVVLFTFSFSERWLNLQSVAQHFPTIFKSGFFISFFSLASTFFMLLRDEEVCFFSTPCLQPISLVCKAALSLLLCKHFVLSNSFMLLFLLQILVFLTLLYKFINNEFLLYCY